MGNGLLKTFELYVIIGFVMALDTPEFQYPCYSDICTFPTEFCNSQEQRCSTCTRAVCKLKESDVPLACRYICLQNHIRKYLNKGKYLFILINSFI